MVLGKRPPKVGETNKNLALPKKPLVNQYKTLATVGKGSFGKIVKVLHLETGVQYVKKESTIQLGDVTFANEIATLEKLNHPNIVAIKEWGREEGNVHIILEFVSGGSLESVLNHLKFPMPERTMRGYVQHILSGLDYCHTHGVVHRDIKASNILLTVNGVAKLADFGGAKGGVDAMGKLLEGIEGMQSTYVWMAPELFKYRFNCKADIWGVGCVILEMATLQKPWAEKVFESQFAAMEHIRDSKEAPEIPENLSPAGRAFVTRCFINDPTLRPTAAELLQDPWFRTDVDGGALVSPFSFTPLFTDDASLEAPQGPGATTPTAGGTSTSTSVEEVKFTIGAGSLSASQTAYADEAKRIFLEKRAKIDEKRRLAEEERELARNNWILALFAEKPEIVEETIVLKKAVVEPVMTGPESLLTTLDFLAMQPLSHEDDY